MGKNKKDKKDNIEEVIKEEIIDETEEAEEVSATETETSEEVISEELKELRKEAMVLRDKQQRLENENEAYKERLTRIAAEYENYRKRTDKEKERIYTDSCEDVLKNMLPVLDNLERAIAVKDTSVEALKTGVDMTIKQFMEALQKLGVDEIDTANGFDPSLHQAVMHVQDENFDANTIAEVFQKGYRKGDKVIRFTMVKVAN
ncbi:nucleotide exchange factor GrpE [uncultured Clostridium sp.]|jgi:molecular chaperone GrpE|uniref:nucleotide exchange factor GrpE n=1 Tax=uncultured Clostridium sp. TaxID=59620 RepID=UPI00262AF9DE|nr:nucleotide exchange factor GrpE [uncultured Clostridium sp.]